MIQPEKKQPEWVGLVNGQKVLFFWLLDSIIIYCVNSFWLGFLFFSWQTIGNQKKTISQRRRKTNVNQSDVFVCVCVCVCGGIEQFFSGRCENDDDDDDEKKHKIRCSVFDSNQYCM